jgi:hypothetical protein
MRKRNKVVKRNGGDMEKKSLELLSPVKTNNLNRREFLKSD